jgi:hypothetical protein
LLPGEPLELRVTAPREKLVKHRPELPPGALVLEAGAIDDLVTAHIATLRLDGAELHAEATSEERSDQVIEMVAHDVGERAALTDEVAPIEQRLNERRRPTPSALGRLPHEPDAGSGASPPR